MRCGNHDDGCVMVTDDMVASKGIMRVNKVAVTVGSCNTDAVEMTVTSQ